MLEHGIRHSNRQFRIRNYIYCFSFTLKASVAGATVCIVKAVHIPFICTENGAAWQVVDSSWKWNMGKHSKKYCTDCHQASQNATFFCIHWTYFLKLWTYWIKTSKSTKCTEMCKTGFVLLHGSWQDGTAFYYMPIFYILLVLLHHWSSTWTVSQSFFLS